MEHVPLDTPNQDFTSPMEHVPLSRKLKNWHELEFGEFLKELEKVRKKSFSKVQSLQSDIAKTDRAIDQIVYELYGLTTEEIQIVEAATA